MRPSTSPSTYRLAAALWSVLQHKRQAWRAFRHGDQSVMMSALLDLARKSTHPDAYLLDGRPVAPPILVVYSAEGLQAVGDCAALDKGPTANIAVAITGDATTYEGIMGPAQGCPYTRQIAMIDSIIKRSQQGLRRRAEQRVVEHLAPPCEFSLRRAQYFTASVILAQLFPAHRWTTEAITEMIDVVEKNNQWLGPTIQASALRGESADAVLGAEGLDEVVERYERVFSALAREERERRAAADPDAPDAPDSLPADPYLGISTRLAQEGLSWPDTKALINSFFAASYETVSTSLTEWVYQMAKNPALWDSLRRAEGDERRQRVKASLYEAVRLIAPLPILLRRAEWPCTLEVVAADGRRRPLAIEAGQLVLGLNIAPLRDPEVFPEPQSMRLSLTTVQRDRIRLAWGLRASKSADGPDRFCQGFSYSIALMKATIDALLRDYEAPSMITDSPIHMFGTQARRDFVAHLPARR